MRFPKTKISMAVLLSASVLAGCSSTQQTAATDGADSEYRVLNMKTDSNVYNATASASTRMTKKVPVGGESESADNLADEGTMAATEETVAAPSFESQEVTVNFALESAVLTDEDKATIDAMVTELDADRIPELSIRIDGYTDATGPDAYNYDLSQRRAQAVADYLAQSDITATVNWRIKGNGDASPVASNDSESGRAENRRAEVVVDAPQDGLASADQVTQN